MTVRPPTRSASAPRPLDLLAAAFAELEAAGVRFDGRDVRGLPPRPLTPAGLRRRLLHPATAPATRDEVFRTLLTRVRADEPGAAVLTVGLLHVGLRRAAARLIRAETPPGGEFADVEADLLTAAFDALRTVDVDRPRLARELVAAAYRSARRACRAELGHASRRAPAAAALPPPPLAAHPDFVLADAVTAGALTRVGTYLIGETRLAGRSTADVAADLGLSPATARRRRARAERRLVAWLASR